MTPCLRRRCPGGETVAALDGYASPGARSRCGRGSARTNRLTRLRRPRPTPVRRSGYVLQEQSEPPATPVTAEDIAAFNQRFPRTFAAAAAHTPDEKFTRSLDLLCAGIATLIP